MNRPIVAAAMLGHSSRPAHVHLLNKIIKNLQYDHT